MNKYDLVMSAKFKRDLKLIRKQGKNTKKLDKVIELLASDEKLPQQYRDHALEGAFFGCRECHIEPDWLLIYEKFETELILYLTRTGSHSELF